MRGAALAKRRSTPSFLSLTSWTRPTTLSGATRQVPFTDKPSLTSALTNMQSGDYIYYNGTGALPISSTTSYGFKIEGKNPNSTVTIDFGTSQSIWDAGAVSGNYVAFSTTAKNYSALLLDNCSNLTIYGGDYTAGEGNGISIYGPISNITLWDAYIHTVGANGLAVNPITTGGATSSVDTFNFRGEVNRFAMDPSLDPHPDKGSGSHGAILHASSGDFDNNTIVVYAHDSLKPGETYNGTVWPEGGGGAVIEAGESPGSGLTGSYNNNTYYARGENLLMIPNGTNPGSTQSQFGGNVIVSYGSLAQNGATYGWIEGTNCTGAVFFGSSGNWHNATPSVTVLHGRHSNVNQSTAGSNISEPYDSRWGVSYNDCL